MQARWIELGAIDPGTLYDTAQGVAEAQAADAEPVVLWGRCDRVHLSLGASQGGHEADLETCRAHEIGVYRRPVGGGAALVDPEQLCFFLIMPRDRAPRRAAFFETCLRPATDVFHRFGLDVAPHGRGDLWLGERKILGSGAATVNACHLFGASFLLRFDGELFARLVASPSEGFRRWLREALGTTMTAWSRETEPPPEQAIRDAFRAAVERRLEWSLRDDACAPAELSAAAEARGDTTDLDSAPGARPIPGGIKLRHGMYLTEEGDARRGVRMLLDHGVIERVEVWPGVPGLERCEGRKATAPSLYAAVRPVMGRDSARRWSSRLAAIADRVRSRENG